MSTKNSETIETAELETVAGGAAPPSNASEGPLSGWFTPVGSDGKPGQRIPILTSLGHHNTTGETFTGTIGIGDQIGSKGK
jgi:hypothetical protein